VRIPARAFASKRVTVASPPPACVTCSFRVALFAAILSGPAVEEEGKTSSEPLTELRQSALRATTKNKNQIRERPLTAILLPSLSIFLAWMRTPGQPETQPVLSHRGNVSAGIRNTTRPLRLIEAIPPRSQRRPPHISNRQSSYLPGQERVCKAREYCTTQSNSSPKPPVVYARPGICGGNLVKSI